MLARLTEEGGVVVVAAASETAPAVARLPQGSLAYLGAAAARSVSTWIPVTLLDGKKGYVEKSVQWDILPEFTLAQSQADLQDKPGPTGNVIRTMKRGAQFHVVEAVDVRGTSWMRIRQPSGGEGYLPAKARLNVVGGEEKGVGGFELEA